MPSRAIMCGFMPPTDFAVEGERALGRRVDAREQVEERRLAGAVGADERDDLAFVDVQRHVADGLQAAELHRDVVCFYQMCHRRSPSRALLEVLARLDWPVSCWAS